MGYKYPNNDTNLCENDMKSEKVSKCDVFGPGLFYEDFEDLACDKFFETVSSPTSENFILG